jgi:hypothetical protein
VNRQPTRPMLGPTPRRRPRLRWLAASTVPVAVLVVAALLGRPWSRPDPAPAAGAPTGHIVVGDSAGIDQTPRRWQAGVPLGWAHTRRGAIGAAAGYASVLSAVWFLADGDRRHRALAVMAAPEALVGLQTAQDGVAAGVARGPFGASLNRRGVRSMLRTSLLGYRVDQYTPTEAQLALWAVVLYGNDGGLAPQALYATSTLRLGWVGDWKLLEASTVPGPVPVHGQATPSPAQELVDAAEDFKEFGYAPAA